VGLAGYGIGLGASIPAWLDDAISEWNEDRENEEVPIRFVDIKDSFVWYMLPQNDEFGHKEIRNRVHEIVLANGYLRTDEEELVTTGKPPSPIDPHIPKKCWRRSYVLDINALSDTRSTASGQRAGQRQRMLTSLVCEDEGYWFMGFRIVQ
jgi:hypothetical protein